MLYGLLGLSRDLPKLRCGQSVICSFPQGSTLGWTDGKRAAPWIGALAEEGCRKLLQKSASLDLDACHQAWGFFWAIFWGLGFRV